MDLHAPFTRDANEPLCLQLLPPTSPPAEGVRELCFEYTSRGDRVPGRLLLPAGDAGPHPLVIVQQEGARTGYAEAVCAGWPRRGAAIAAIDLPLHGDRASPKLTERIHSLFEARSRLEPAGADVWVSFVRQAVHDLHAAVDGLTRHEALDPERIGFAGFGLGAIVGTPFCAQEPRLRAAALALAGGAFGPGCVDPVHHAPQLGARPLLLVNASRDARVPRSSAEALHRAAPDGARTLWFDCDHDDLPAEALDAIWEFLAGELGIPD